MSKIGEMDILGGLASGGSRPAPLHPADSGVGTLWAPRPETPPGRDSATIISFPFPDGQPRAHRAELIRLLFVCRTHTVLSPMAEGIAEAACERLDITIASAGLTARRVDPRAVMVMAEVGIDISDTPPMEVRDLALGKYDIVVSLGIHKLGLHARQMAVAWDIPEFTRVTEATALPRLRQVRDAISVRVHALGAILTATNRA